MLALGSATSSTNYDQCSGRPDGRVITRSECFDLLMTAGRKTPRHRSNRDDFPAAVKRALAERVAYQCSRPDCRIQTMGPNADPSKSAHEGKAAHISAASPAGPRGDPNLTPQQRSSIHNGIWLCSNCATIVDTDQLRYPQALLREWKEQAERSALNARGKPAPRAEDAVQLLASAFTGQTQRAIPGAIANVHAATERALGALDPRIIVRSGFEGGVSTLRLEAVAPVSFKFSVPPESQHAWRRGLQAALAFGTPARLPATGISATGSPLIESLITPADLEGAVLEVLPESVEAHVRLRFANSPLQGGRGADEEPFTVDFAGSLSAGSEAFTFVGLAFGGLLSLYFCRGWRRETPQADVCSLGWDFTKWAVPTARGLPYFDAMHQLVEYLRANASMEIRLLIEGRSVGGETGSLPADEPGLIAIAALLRHLSNARLICASAGVPVPFSAPEQVRSEELRAAELEARLLRGPATLFSEDLAGRLRARYFEAPTVLAVEDESHEALVAEFIETDRRISLFGRRVPLRDRRVRIYNARLNLVDEQARPDLASDPHDAGSVEFEFEPAEGFRCELQLLPLPA